MKFKRNNRTDYQTPLIVGAIMLFIGVGGLVADPSNLTMNIINTIGAVILFTQAFIRYKRKKQLIKDF